MEIEAACPAFGHSARISATFRSLELTCPACKQKFTVEEDIGARSWTFALAVFFIAVLLLGVSQIRGSEQAGTSHEFGLWPPDQNRHEIRWGHGWPWSYLKRHTAFRRAAPDFNPADESAWAVLHKVTEFHLGLLLADATVSLAIAGGLAGLVFRAKQRRREPPSKPARPSANAS